MSSQDGEKIQAEFHQKNEERKKRARQLVTSQNYPVSISLRDLPTPVTASFLVSLPLCTYLDGLIQSVQSQLREQS